MVILLTGDNAYEAAEEIRRLEHTLGVRPEQVDTDKLDQARLADIMKSTSLFVSRRLIVIRDLSTMTDLWTKAAEWVSFVDDETTLVLRDEKPDRRTKAYKQLAASAKVVEAASWTEKQSSLAEKWLVAYAKDMHLGLSVEKARNMVARSLVPGTKTGQRIIDQLMLVRALEALRGSSEVTDEMIATVMPESTSDAVFDLLAIAADGDNKLLFERLREFRVSQDGYQLFALVVSQWTQLVMITITRGEATLDIHPFVRQKLSELGRKFTVSTFRESTHLAATLDAQLKSTSLDPWDALARLLASISHR